jgi:chitin synthase
MWFVSFLSLIPGVFCVSMQFVILLELIGTVIMPAAIIYLIVLVLEALITGAPAVMPLILMGLSLSLPGLIILLTTRTINRRDNS